MPQAMTAWNITVLFFVTRKPSTKTKCINRNIISKSQKLQIMFVWSIFFSLLSISPSRRTKQRFVWLQESIWKWTICLSLFWTVRPDSSLLTILKILSKLIRSSKDLLGKRKLKIILPFINSSRKKLTSIWKTNDIICLYYFIFVNEYLYFKH